MTGDALQVGGTSRDDKVRQLEILDRAKGRDPVGGEKQRIPLLARQPKMVVPDSSPPSSVTPRPPGSPVLSPTTEALLTDAGRAAAEEKPEAKPDKPAKDDGDDDIFASLFNAYGRTEHERVLNNKERRVSIGARSSEMKVEDLLERGYVEQDVPIIEGKYSVRFRSLHQHEFLFLQRFLVSEMEAEAKKKNGSQRVAEAVVAGLQGLCFLAASITSLNGKSFPDHLDQNGEPVEELFRHKLKTLLKQSSYVIADLMLNGQWFDVRVRKLLNPDSLGNG